MIRPPWAVIRSTYRDNTREPRRVWYWKTSAVLLGFWLGLMLGLLIAVALFDRLM